MTVSYTKQEATSRHKITPHVEILERLPWPGYYFEKASYGKNMVKAKLMPDENVDETLARRDIGDFLQTGLKEAGIAHLVEKSSVNFERGAVDILDIQLRGIDGKANHELNYFLIALAKVLEYKSKQLAKEMLEKQQKKEGNG